MAYTTDIYEMLNHIAENQERILAKLDKLEQTEDLALNAAQASAFLGISTATLWRWEKQGKVVKEVLGGMVGYSRNKLKLIRK